MPNNFLVINPSAYCTPICCPNSFALPFTNSKNAVPEIKVSGSFELGS